MSLQLQSRISVCNIYLPNSRELNTQEIHKLINQLPSPRIILGDFNAHSPIWGSEKTDARGLKIEELTNKLNIVTLNTGEATRFNSSNGNFSAIDLSMCDASLAPLLTWSTLGRLHGSDHFPIRLESNTLIKKDSGIFLPKWNLKQANWEQYRQIIEQNISTISIEEDPIQEVESFKNLILEAASKTVRKTTNKLNHKSVPWWNTECGKAIAESKSAFNRLKRHKNLENLLEFKRLRARARYIVKKSRRESWTKYTSSITSSTPIPEVWSKIRAIKGEHGSNKIVCLQKGAEVTGSDTDICETLADHYESQSSDENYSAEFLNLKRDCESNHITIENQDDHPLSQEISLEELETALESCNSSSPGPDNIPYAFLVNLPENGKKHLLNLYNHIYLHHKFPPSWAEAIILPLHKPNKPRNQASSYRPISLTCSMCKILEKIVNNRLTWYIETKNLLSPYQNAFRKNRSTTDNLIYLESEIHAAFANKQKLTAIFFDLKKAYDTTWTYRIIKTIADWGVQGHLLHFIMGFLKNRTFKVRHNGVCSSLRRMQNGVPQGSVISTTLFLIAVNSALEIIPAPVRSCMYADDLVVFARGRNSSYVRSRLQRAIDSLQNWTRKTGFTFSVEKTKCIHFSRKTLGTYPALKLENQELSYTNEIKFLGMIFDRTLTWRSHITYLKTSCSKVLNLMKTLANHDWGADTTTLLNIYKSMIRSRLDYGSTIYSTASKTQLERLNPIQNTAIRIATGAFRTSPSHSLCCLSGELPLPYRRNLQTLSHSLKILENPKNLNNPNFTPRTSNRTYQNKPFSHLPFHMRKLRLEDSLGYQIPEITSTRHTKTPPWLFVRTDTDVSLSKYSKDQTHPSVILREFIRVTRSLPNSHFIYTDASKINNKVGAAVVSDSTLSKFQLPNYCSIYSSELFAIMKALELSQTYPAQKFAICTDSLSSLQSLRPLYSANPLVQSIREKLSELSKKGYSFTLIYVPSHVGIRGNEEADLAAKQAALSLNSPVEQLYLLADVKNNLRNLIENKWQEKWTTTTSKLKEVKPIAKGTLQLPATRREQVVVARMRIGHTRITHGHLIEKKQAPICDACQVPITVKHLLCECPKYANQRNTCKITTLKESLETGLTAVKFVKVSDLTCKL